MKTSRGTDVTVTRCDRLSRKLEDNPISMFGTDRFWPGHYDDEMILNERAHFRFKRALTATVMERAT